MDPHTPRNRRRRKLVYREVQLRGVAIGLCVACLVALISFQLVFFSLWAVSSKAPPGPVAMLPLDEVYGLLLTRFLITLVLSIPIAALVGISFSFKFAGPLYRFRKYFMDLQGGRWDLDCRLREKDDLKELCAAINTGLDGFRGLLHEGHGVLTEVRAGLPAGSGAASGSSELAGRIDRILAAYRERFPLPVGTPGEPATSGATETESACQLQG